MKERGQEEENGEKKKEEGKCVKWMRLKTFDTLLLIRHLVGNSIKCILSNTNHAINECHINCSRCQSYSNNY